MKVKPGPEPQYTERLQVRVAKDQWRKLQSLAYALDVPISAVVRQAIDDSFARVEGELDDQEAQ
jgi:predicted transcriptional regulator